MAQGFVPHDGLGAFGRLAHQAQQKWHCFRTRARQDRLAARDLQEAGFLVFAPARSREVVYCGVPVSVRVPVFPNLVFIFGTDADVSEAAAKTGRIIEALDLPRPLSNGTMTESRAWAMLGSVPPGRPNGYVDPLAEGDALPSSGFWCGGKPG